MYFTGRLANRYWLAYANYQSLKLRKTYNMFFWKDGNTPISLIMRIACRFHNFSQYILKESTNFFLSETITHHFVSNDKMLPDIDYIILWTSYIFSKEKIRSPGWHSACMYHSSFKCNSFSSGNAVWNIGSKLIIVQHLFLLNLLFGL